MKWSDTPPDTATALAARVLGGHRADLSVVTVLDGNIGDPVTWSVRPGATGCFGTMADDIRAHLGDGVVAIHRPVVVLGLVARILPGWQPQTVLDAQSLARQTVPWARPDDPLVHITPLDGAAARARATARLLVMAMQSRVRRGALR